MSTKALRKELFAAVAMLIVAAIALSGSTYAWFAANTTVTAEDMQVSVKMDTTFLLIKAGHQVDADAVQASPLTVDSATVTNASIKPTALTNSALTNISAIEADNAWYYRYSLDLASSNTTVTAITPIATSTAAFGTGNYVLVNEFTLSVADGSNVIENIKVGHCTISALDSGAQAVNVIVATENGAQEFTGAGGDGSATLVSSLNSEQVAYVKIYVYWNGNDNDVYTNNLANLKGTDIVVTFTGTPQAV